MKLLCYDPTKKKNVLCGEIIGDTFFRWVKPEHFMRVLQGYGIQEIAFQELVGRKVKKIILKETDTSQRWGSEVSDWLKNGKIADFGNGPQRFLSLKYMRTHKIPEEDEEKENKRIKTISR